MRPNRQNARTERGFSLVELIIVIVLLGLVTSALTASFITAMRGNDTAAQRIKETNDAQVIAGYLTRDAQAAGGSNPASNTIDPNIGVSLSDDAGCTDATATLVLRLAWVDYPSNVDAAKKSRVVVYYYKSSQQQLVRRSCTNGALDGSLILGSHISNSPAPSASCSPSCGGIPDTVSLTLTATNNPVNAPSPYTYTLTAALRGQSGTAPTGSTSSTVPLLLLGGGSGCPAGGGDASGISSQGGGSSTIQIIGGAYINGYNAGCPAVDLQGSPSYTASGGTTVLSPGTCNGTACSTMTSPIPDPFAGLAAPAGVCSGGSNPAPVAGHYSPGVYPQLLNIGGTNVLDPGNYVFCNGVNVSGTLTGTNVLMYFANSSLTVTGTLNVTAATTGTYANVVAFQRNGNTTDFSICCNNNAVANFGGVIYAPTANVDFHNGTITALAVIARSVSWSAGGNGGTTIGQPPPALVITGPGSLPSPWTRGVAYPATTVTATGGAGVYTWSATGLPAGVTINSSSGVISGTPTASCSCNVTVKVTDGLGTQATRNYTINVNGALSITGPAVLPDWTRGKAFSAITVTTSGGTAPLTFSATGLPPGLSINGGTGVISGTPTTAGTYSSIVVTVNDSVGASATRTYAMTINPPITITGPASLPNGQQGVAYASTTVTSTGGTGAISWGASGLPAGMSINAGTGAIGGTPTVVGSFTVNVTATDAIGATGTRSYTITVSVVPLNVTNVVLTNADGQAAKSDTIAITFNKALDVTTLCGGGSGWSGAGNQTINGANQVTVTIANGAGPANDVLSITGATRCTGGFKLGSVDLGSPGYVTATRTFGGNNPNKSTIDYDATTFTVTITLGQPSGATQSGVAASTVVYTPDPAIRDTFGNAVAAPSYSYTNRRF